MKSRVTVTVAIGYTRLSQNSDTSIDRQKSAIEDYARTHEWELDEIYNDGERSSGFNTDRSEYQHVRRRIEDEEVDVVIVYDRTRIGRDFDERMRFVLDLRQHGIKLHTAIESEIDLSEPSKVVMESFHAAKDDEGKREEIEKSKRAVEERQEKGCFQGLPPIGLEFADDKCHLQRSDQWDNVMRVFELVDEKTYAEIKDETGIGISTISRINSRGRSYYLDRLEQYSTGSNPGETFRKRVLQTTDSCL